MSIRDFYNNIGSDYQRVLHTLMNDEIAEMFAVQFLDDKTYENLIKAVNNKDIEASFSYAHALKGVTGNLGLYKLYDAVCLLTEQLRPKNEVADEKLLNDVTLQYELVIEELKKYIGTK